MSAWDGDTAVVNIEMNGKVLWWPKPYYLNKGGDSWKSKSLSAFSKKNQIKMWGFANNIRVSVL